MKIAFCFLTYDEIVKYDVWNKFFENIDTNKYTVFIHPKNLSFMTNIKYTFSFNIVQRRINTIRKEDISIVKATIRLFEEAINSSTDITHVVFLSQSCIPLYPFNTLYNIITKFPISVVSYINHNKKERYHRLSSYIKKYIDYNNFVKQQPNMVLIRNDVELLINNDCTSHFKDMECPDEHYFINILNGLFKKKLLLKQTHFCNYDFNKTQALEFINVNSLLINYLRNYGFLFMRKVNKKSYVDQAFLFS